VFQVDCRNAHGNQHLASSQLTRGALADDLEGDKEANEEFKISVAQSLWRDLQKYQRKHITGARDDDEQEDDAVDELEELLKGEEEDEEFLFDEAMTIQIPEDDDTVIFTSPCEVVEGLSKSAGTIELTRTRLTFHFSPEQQPMELPRRLKSHPHGKEIVASWAWALHMSSSRTWAVPDIYRIRFCQYMQQPGALDFSFVDHTSLFCNLQSDKTATQLFLLIRKCQPPHLQPFLGRIPRNVLSRSRLESSGLSFTQAWVQRKITNYEYIQVLNAVAGRSKADLSQYPIFPWVISDYTSKELELKNPKTFRDFRWPMGVQRVEVRESLQERYKSLVQMNLEAQKAGEEGPQVMPPFHFGTHYSTAGFVLWYLMRMEPYTSLHIHLQDGRFDKPDRLFQSVPACWEGCTTNASDVKELIPEFFDFPEMFSNSNDLDLGKTQLEEQLGDIQLPPWAKDPYDFVAKHREALESEYVSLNLHNWIDLIFGYKQRPPALGGNQATVDACNVFFHLTYSGSVDLPRLKEQDPVLYETTIAQIREFGQTPEQLFIRPHPQRVPLHQADLVWKIGSVMPGSHTLSPQAPKLPHPKKLITHAQVRASHQALLMVVTVPELDRLVTVDADRVVGHHNFQALAPEEDPPFRFKLDDQALEISQKIMQGRSETHKADTSSEVSKADTLKEKKAHEETPKRVTLQKSHVQSQRLSPILDDNPVKSTDQHDPVREVTERRIQGPAFADSSLTSQLFAVCASHRLLFSCGHWDFSFKVTLLNSGQILQSVAQHHDVITGLCTTEDRGLSWVVTASRDCTVMVWKVREKEDRPVVVPPIHVLHGHDDAVTCISADAALDVVVSGSEDGTVILHTLHHGEYVRTIAGARAAPLEDGSEGKRQPLRQTSTKIIDWVDVSRTGHIIVYSGDANALYSYSRNGTLLAHQELTEKLHAFVLSEDGNVLITGGDERILKFRWVSTLKYADDGPRETFNPNFDGASELFQIPPFQFPIRSISMTPKERHLLVGLENGEMYIVALDSTYLRQRLQQRLLVLGL